MRNWAFPPTSWKELALNLRYRQSVSLNVKRGILAAKLKDVSLFLVWSCVRDAQTESRPSFSACIQGANHRSSQRHSRHISLILQSLSLSRKLGIDDIAADRVADWAHGLANRIERRTALILHKMPAISDLIDIWQAFRYGLTISTASVTGDNRDRRLTRLNR